MAYYVKIENPREFRRDILENSKKVIGCLQANRNVVYLREQKRQLIESLQQQIEELGMLMQKLDGIMPDKQLREEAIQEAKIEQERLAREAEERQKQQQALSASQAAELLHHTSVKPEAPASEPVPEPEPAPEMPPADEEKELADALSSIESKLSSLQ